MADKKMLKMRRRIKRKKPSFKRQEWFRQPMLGEKWRSPRGRKSDLRRDFKARGRKPNPGYSSPLAVRGLNRKGFREVRVFNVSDISKIDPKTQAIVIAGTVGRKKRNEILKTAFEKGIHVANK